jgi:predicted DNA-binding transcriptional regulator YafY
MFPFALLSRADNWLPGAWCRLRKEFRLFRPDRIIEVKFQPDKFTPHNLTVAEYLEFLKNK